MQCENVLKYTITKLIPVTPFFTKWMVFSLLFHIQKVNNVDNEFPFFTNVHTSVVENKNAKKESY